MRRLIIFTAICAAFRKRYILSRAASARASVRANQAKAVAAVSSVAEAIITETRMKPLLFRIDEPLRAHVGALRQHYLRAKDFRKPAFVVLLLPLVAVREPEAQAARRR